MSAFTAVCSLFVQGRCTRKVCNFAHTAEQLRIGTCSFSTAKSVCKNENCIFIHHSETESDYTNRTGLTFAQGKQRIFETKCKTVKKVEVKPMIPKATYISIKETERVAKRMNDICFNQDDMLVFLSRQRVQYFRENPPKNEEDVVIVF